MADQSGQERTEQATAKRLRESREKGQIARSKELTTFVVLLAGAAGIQFFGDQIMSSLLATMRESLQINVVQLTNKSFLPEAFLHAVSESLRALTPLLLLLVLAAALSPLALGGWAFSPQAMGFKWERLNPIKGLGKIFAWRGVMELIKALAKFALVAATAVWVLMEKKAVFISLGTESVPQALVNAGNLLIWCFLMITASLAIVAAVDVPFQLWDYGKQLRMTRQEVRDEFKETDGNPEVRSRIRNIQREMARRRMMAEVPKADVIVTNPTHYAVALRYDQTKMRAPIVVAKGADLIAAQIRIIGSRHKVPVVTAPSLARAVYYSTELNKEIPAGLYVAVAHVLAYVFRLRRSKNNTINEDINMNDLPIPEDLQHD